MELDTNIPTSIFAVFKVSWGYEIELELYVTERNWKKISAGKGFSIRGNGYYYEGEFFWDFWNFRGTINRLFADFSG